MRTWLLASRLVRDCRGVSAMELALILPLLVLFSAGTIDVSRQILLTQKLQSAAYTLADLTARIKPTETGSIGDILLAIREVVKPFDFTGRGRAIVTSVVSEKADNKPTVGWQCLDASGLRATSAIGLPLRAARLPDGLDMRKGETVIVAEVMFDYRPLFSLGLFEARVIRRMAYSRPRLDDRLNLSCLS